MPVIIAGRAGAVWGLNEQVGMIAQMGEADASIEENPSKNADGEVEMTSFYNPTRAVEIGGVFTGGGGQSLGVAMVTAALLLIGSPSGAVYCKGLRSTQACDGFLGIHLRGIQYDLF